MVLKWAQNYVRLFLFYSDFHSYRTGLVTSGTVTIRKFNASFLQVLSIFTLHILNIREYFETTSEHLKFIVDYLLNLENKFAIHTGQT